MVKYLLSVLAVVAALLIARALIPQKARAMAGQFGTYTDAYLARKAIKDRDAEWKELCKGGGRYQAMSEAYALGLPDPCNPKAKVWVR